MNNNLLPSDEFIEYEGQFYTNPQKGLDEQNSFIDNLRDIQNANNAEINAQTYNLGTAVPSNLGGLVGGEGYFTSRYQTPQNVSVAANLRAAAQAQALNEAMGNEVAMWKQRYNRAYSDYKRRNRNNNGGGGDGGGDGNPNRNTYGGEPDLNPTDYEDDEKDPIIPPNPDDYRTEGQKQNEDIQNRIKQETGADMPEWLINVLKIVG